MKIVAIIPIKKISKRVKRKNFIKVGKKKLYNFILEKVKKCNFDEVYVDSDSYEIKMYCKKNRINFIPRLPKLSKDNASGNDLLNYHAKIIKADIYFQLFITAPLLKISTINNCIKIIKNNKKFDSILTSRKIYTWYWFNNRPINYNPLKLPRSQDAKPMVVETTGLYGIKSDVLRKRKCRIGHRPYFYNVSDDESIDLDNKNDFKLLKSLINEKNY